MDFSEHKLIGIIGATASGKSGLAMRLAERLGCEIVSVDSVQIFKGLDVGSNKPTASDMSRVVHHLVDIIPPDEYFSANDFAREARNAVSKILPKGKTPIFVGGTGFYLYTLFCGSDFEKSLNLEERERLMRFADENGKTALHALLAEVDGESAAAIHPNNAKRVIRAIEIYRSTGVKKSQGTGLRSGKEFRQKMPYLFQITLERETLYDKINARVDEMLSRGLIDEVDALMKYVDPSAQSLQAIGYKEIIRYLNGLCGKEEAVNAVKQNTRNYAKRQLTYFKRLDPILLDGTQDFSRLAQIIAETAGL